MNDRDPRHDPIVGDILKKRKKDSSNWNGLPYTQRHVTRVDPLKGRVYYEATASDCEHRVRIETWRAWARKAEIITRGIE